MQPLSLYFTFILHFSNLLTKKIRNDIIISKKWEKVTKRINNRKTKELEEKQMNKKIKIISLILILTILINTLISIISKSETYAVTQRFSTDIESIDTSKYPGIKERIKQLQSQYPNWNFKILYTGLDWNEVISNEYTGHGSSPKNLVYKTSNYQGEWICAICGEKGYDNGNWKCASEQAIKYMMDPRNSLNTSDIFQFEELTNSGCDINTLKTMTNGTFLSGHEQGIINAANNNNVNAYYIVARLIQEQGKSGTVLTSGSGYNGQYVGYYNAFNIAASGNSTAEILTNALAYAQKKGWTSLDASIDGGISFLAKQYIQKGQNTLYLQKFDVEATNGLYSNQYMQNILAAQSEGTTLRNTYINMNTMSSSHTFIIPVYENMPSEPCSRPDTNGTSTIESDLVKVNVDSTLRIRNSPNGSTTVGWLYKDEIVTRLEKATSKVAGTYWDKVQKSDGTTGYAARETYESESSYKLYLVPINDSGSNNDNNTNDSTPTEPVDTSKVKVDKENKIITVTPDVIANDILEAYGGSVKITKADGSYLPNGENELIATGFIVEDKYTVVKKGDCNGDGKITSSDYVLIKNHIMGTSTLEGANKKASDYNGDGNVTSSDYVLIKNYIMSN